MLTNALNLKATFFCIVVNSFTKPTEYYSRIQFPVNFTDLDHPCTTLVNILTKLK